MFGGLQLLLLLTVLASVAKSEILSASDSQICTNLCSGCDGTSTFDNEICDCRIEENDEKGAECLKHVIKGQTENPSLGSTSSDQENKNRRARCDMFRPTKRMEKGDVDRVVNYFVSGGPASGLQLIPNQTPNKYASLPNFPRNAMENNAEDVVGAKNTETTVVKSSSERKISESETNDSSPVSTGQSSNVLVGDPHVINSRTLPLGRHGLLRAVPEMLLGIPRALMRPPNPSYVGMHVPTFLGVPQNSHLYSRSQYPHLLGTVAAGTRGILRNIDDTVTTYVPGNMVGVPQQPQIISPYVGIPNPMMTGVPAPGYYPGFMGATQYSPMMAPVASHIDERSSDNTKMMERKNQVKSEDSEILRQSNNYDRESRALLLDTFQQHNQYIQLLQKQYMDYMAMLVQLQNPPVPYHLKNSYWNDQLSGVKEYSNNLGSPISSRVAEPPISAIEEWKKTENFKNSPIPTKAMNEENRAISWVDVNQRNSQEPTSEKEECDWKCLPKVSTKTTRDPYSFNRMKRGSVEDKEKSDSIVSESEVS